MSIDVEVAIASEISPKECCARLAVAEAAEHGEGRVGEGGVGGEGAGCAEVCGQRGRRYLTQATC